MTDLPIIPKDREWSEAIWRAGLDEAVRRDRSTYADVWSDYIIRADIGQIGATCAHASTLLDAGIVKPVVSEAEQVWEDAYLEFSMPASPIHGKQSAIAIIQAALDKARAGNERPSDIQRLTAPNKRGLLHAQADPHSRNARQGKSR